MVDALIPLAFFAMEHCVICNSLKAIAQTYKE